MHKHLIEPKIFLNVCMLSSYQCSDEIEENQQLLAMKTSKLSQRMKINQTPF